MAKKRTKKQAKSRIPRLPTLPPIFVPALGPAAPFYVVGKSAEIIADALIDIDPLDRLASVVNDPTIQIAPEMVEMINNPNIAMTRRGEFVQKSSTPGSRAQPIRARAQPVRSGRDVIRQSGQFTMQGFDLPQPARRTRKKSKNDSKLSRAFKEANSRLRLKNGQLRKGKTQADVAKLAHRLRKKMK